VGRNSGLASGRSDATNVAGTCFTAGVTDALDGLDGAERLACRVAERVTGATARAWDVGGRDGVVDAFLDYPDGRTGAFEVTRAATDQEALQLDNLLGRDGFSWRLPGRWWWILAVSDVRELPRLRQCFKKVVLQCEAQGVDTPASLCRRHVQGLNEDVLWLGREATADLQGYPDVPAVDGARVRTAFVSPAPVGGMVDESLSGLNGALETAFGAEHLQRRVRKLRRTPADEHHLFLIIHETDLRFDVTSGLMGTQVPQGVAWRPQGISHLWLAPAFCERVLLGTDTGWSEAYPYDD
jgi:hypothetical protein